MRWGMFKMGLRAMSRVGWVERSDTHQSNVLLVAMGIALLCQFCIELAR